MEEPHVAGGLCQCGCGQSTALAPFNAPARGWVKGEPLRFLKGHARRTDIRDGKKRCSVCHEWKHLADYPKSKTGRDGLDHRCRGCHRDRRLRYTIEQHGITWDEYQAMLEAQNHACALCFRGHSEVSLGIDHDHATGRVRGLLCRSCNAALGQFQDDPAALRRAADFIEAHRVPLEE